MTKLGGLGGVPIVSNTGTVVAFAGAIGSGKSTLSTLVAQQLGWFRVSFGDYVRDYAQEQGLDAADRAVLQRVGQGLVLSNVGKFVQAVLAPARREGWEPGANLIVDGVRHTEARWALREAVVPADLKLVYVTVDEVSRQRRAAREHEIDPRTLSRYDQHIAEAQVPRILREYADLTVDNGLPPRLAVDQVIDRLQLKSRAMAAA